MVISLKIYEKDISVLKHEDADEAREYLLSDIVSKIDKAPFDKVRINEFDAEMFVEEISEQKFAIAGREAYLDLYGVEICDGKIYRRGLFFVDDESIPPFILVDYGEETDVCRTRPYANLKKAQSVMKEQIIFNLDILPEDIKEGVPEKLADKAVIIDDVAWCNGDECGNFYRAILDLSV